MVCTKGREAEGSDMGRRDLTCGQPGVANVEQTSVKGRNERNWRSARCVQFPQPRLFSVVYSSQNLGKCPTKDSTSVTGKRSEI
jgi:hypothetical protein